MIAIYDEELACLWLHEHVRSRSLVGLQRDVFELLLRSPAPLMSADIHAALYGPCWMPRALKRDQINQIVCSIRRNWAVAQDAIGPVIIRGKGGYTCNDRIVPLSAEVLP